jgi:hypothetical protein
MRKAGLDTIMADARRSRFDLALVSPSHRIARSVKDFLN